ncbi:MAG TPA: hypothetical protein VLE72_03330 [Candidatus Saccharimonadales bacterium]|nr:hypothetical protein [Candidatus Saccharimonadales bacterium]
MLQTLGIIAGILALIAPIPYIRDIIKGTTKPNRATWFIWTALLAIALAGQLASGGTYSTLLTAGDLLGTFIVLMLAVKFGVGGWQTIDKLALAGAALGLILWRLFNSPALALAMIILVDYSGGLPTILKAHRDPDSETISSYWLVGIGSALAVISVGKLDIVLMVYPFFLAILMGLIVGAMLTSPTRRRVVKHA